MESAASGSVVSQFLTSTQSLGEIGADVAGKLIAAAADIALIIDDDGVIQDVASHSEELVELARRNWAGRPWLDTVTVESRPKVEALLRDSGTDKSRARQVNHPVAGQDDIPVLY